MAGAPQPHVWTDQVKRQIAVLTALLADGARIGLTAAERASVNAAITALNAFLAAHPLA